MQPRPPTVRPQVILPIQYLRGIAALMVTWHHATGQIAGLKGLLPSEFGTSGVNLFFVISGFIMLVTKRRSPVGPWQFMSRRIVRVVPLYWLLTLSMAALALVGPSLFKTLRVEPLTLVQSLLFIPHYSQSFPDSIWPLLVPGWTLNYEMFFYLVLALVLFLPASARLTALVGTFVVLSLIGRVFGPFESALARTYTDALLLEFAGGALIGAVWLGGRLRLPTVVSLFLVVAGTALLVMREHPLFGTFSQTIGAIAIVVGALDERWAGQRSRVLQALGDSSYSLYLTHLFTLAVLRVIWVKLVPGAPSLAMALAFMGVAMPVCACVGWLTYRWIETPMLRRMNGRKRPAAPVVAASRLA